MSIQLSNLVISIGIMLGLLFGTGLDCYQTEKERLKTIQDKQKASREKWEIKKHNLEAGEHLACQIYLERKKHYDKYN